MSVNLQIFQLILIFSCFVFCTSQGGPGSGGGRAKIEKDLREQLLKNYEKAVIPTYNSTQVLDVRIEMLLTGIQEVDIRKNRLTVSAWINLEWFDPRLRWNSSANANIIFLPFNQEDIYTPDVTLLNSYVPTHRDLYAPTMAMVYTYAEVVWMPAASLSVLCNMSAHDWPYDQHTCEFIFGHASRDKSSLDLNPNALDIDISRMGNAPTEWEVIKTGMRSSSFFENVGDDYAMVRFNITLRRKASPYLRSVYFAPHILLFISLLIFWIHDQNVRLLFGVLELTASIALAICFYVVAPGETKAARTIIGLPILILIALVICAMLDCMKGIRIPLPDGIRLRKRGNRNSVEHNFFLSGISTERLTESGESHDIGKVQIEEDSRWEVISFVLRVIIFVLYGVTCFLLSLLTFLNF